ncbi:hypothetical protein A7X67_13180 [Clostridium sp. W14A]|nr:hypothetical protein A7X67_13180 [Clostridium sp. W14A]
MNNIEKLIDEVNGTMSIEGMPLTPADRERIRLCAGDEKKVEETIAELVRKHSTSKEHHHEQQL